MGIYDVITPDYHEIFKNQINQRQSHGKSSSDHVLTDDSASLKILLTTYIDSYLKPMLQKINKNIFSSTIQKFIKKCRTYFLLTRNY